MDKNYDGLRAQIDERTKAEISERGDQVVRDINEQLQRVLDRAPSDASATLLIRKVQDGYKGLLKIYSRQRRFVGGSVDHYLPTVVASIFEEVREQIEDWKRTRSLDVGDSF